MLYIVVSIRTADMDPWAVLAQYAVPYHIDKQGLEALHDNKKRQTSWTTLGSHLDPCAHLGMHTQVKKVVLPGSLAA